MLSSRIKTLLALWCLAELVMFALAIHLFGLGWTLLAELAVGAAGLLLLKRRGSAAMIRLRAAFRGGAGQVKDGRVDEGLVGEGLAVLGALLLLLPGFLSDVVGLVLVVRPLRARAAGWIGAHGARLLRGRYGKGPAKGPAMGGVVDLQPGEWRPVGPGASETGGAPRLRP